jgi:hypothetical protein
MIKKIMNKELIGKEFTLDLGSTPVQVVVKNITKDKVIVEYLNSTPGRIEEFTISDFEYFAMIKIDNNKEQQELLDDAYKNFVKSVENNRPAGYVRKVITKSDFIKESNFNKDFREYWGLKIEERELSLEERYDLIEKDKHSQFVKWQSLGTNRIKEVLDEHNIPTKLITITYNDKTIESYEN